jgi:hypothetical protein
VRELMLARLRQAHQGPFVEPKQMLLASLGSILALVLLLFDFYLQTCFHFSLLHRRDFPFFVPVNQI